MKSQHIAIITGGGTGIGRDLCHRLAKDGHQVLIVGRREALLQETAAPFPDTVQYCVADVAKDAGRRDVIKAMPDKAVVNFLVHHAATLEPVAQIADLEPEPCRQAVAVNLEAPLFMTNLLFPRLTQNSRVLYLSSLLSEQPMSGRSVYGATKAALESLCRSYNLEHQASGIGFACARPGVVDTETLRNEVAKIHPSQLNRLDEFLKETLGKQLLQPEYVGQFLHWLLTRCELQRYSSHTWDIRDANHHAEWQ